MDRAEYSHEQVDVLINDEAQVPEAACAHKGSESSARPVSAASELVASVLSGSDPHGALPFDFVAPMLCGSEHDVAADESASLSAKTVGSAAESASNGGVSALPALPSEGVVSRLLTANPATAVKSTTRVNERRRYSRITFSLIVGVLSMLICAAALAVGYGVLGRFAKAGSKTTVQRGVALADSDAAPATSVGNKAGAAPINSSADLSEASVAAIAERRADALPNNRSENDLHGRSAQAVGAPNETSHAMNEAPPTAAGASLLGRRLGSVKAEPDVRAAEVEQAARARALHAPASQGTAQKAVTSTQTTHSRVGPMDAAHAKSVLPSATAASLIRTNTSAKVDDGKTETHVVDDGPAEAPTAIAASLGHVDPCELIQSVQPVYPREAKKSHVEGNVELRVVVGTDGTVRSVGLVSGAPVLASAAMDAAREFRYKPAMLNGHPIETVQTIDMSFKLKN